MNFLMKITDLSILCKWGNLKNRQCIKNLFGPLYMCVYVYIFILSVSKLIISMVHRDVDEDD